MQFYAPYFLNLLWLTPVLVFCFVASGWIAHKRVRAFLKTTEIRDKLLPHYEQREWPFRAALLLAAFIFSVTALSQPQWGEEKKKIERKGVDVIFMLDVSTSMLAEDTKPSRIQKSKFEIESFVKELKGDRIGMLTFAGSSFMQTPLTLDYSAFLIFLSGVDVGHVPDPGTSLGPAIQKAIAAFPDEKGKFRALIVFSDGEDHAMQIEPAIEEAKKKNVRIYTVGTATAEGAPIPLKDDHGVQTAVKKDRAGNIVITKLNKELLSKVASETGGVYLPATPGEKEVDLILKHLATLGVKKLEDRLITEREDHYQVFLVLALLCLIFEMLVRRGKSPRMMPVSVLMLIFVLHSGFSTPQEKVSEGNQDFEEKKYQSAVQKYREVQVKNPDSPPVEYNLATSLYKIDQYQESAAHLKTAVEKSANDPELQAKAAYNYGNALYRVGDYDGAVESYKKALELNPEDKDSKYNLEFLLNKKSKFDKENQDRKKNNPDQKNNKNQQDKQKDQKNQGGGGSSQDKNQSSGGQKNDKNESSGGGSNQDKNQGDQKNQDQKGSGQQNQDKNQGGQGQNKDNSGKNEDQNQKDQGQGQNQQNDKQQGDQSNPNKDQNQNAGGQGEKEKKENQSQDQKNKGDQQGQNQNKDQSEQNQDKGSDQNKQLNQGNNPDQSQKPDQGPGKSGEPQKDQQGNQPKPGEQGKQDQPPQKSNDQGQQQGQKPQPDQGSAGAAGGGKGEKGEQSGLAAGKPLQGQMSKQDAEYLLNSLEDGEKKLHVMRKPAREDSESAYVEKDW